MKTRYINDVSKDIKALTVMGNISEERKKQLKTRINNYTKEIYRLKDKSTFQSLSQEESELLQKYLQELPKTQEELKALEILEPEKKENKNQYGLMFLIFGFGVFLLMRKK